MEIVSLRERPLLLEEGIAYLQRVWGSPKTMRLYEDCLRHALDLPLGLPEWYFLLDGEGVIVGCAGLIPNDFISRMDLFPWLCALYVEPAHRGNAHGAGLIQRAKAGAARAGFEHLYLCTDHVGLYERHGFEFLGEGYDPFGGSARIYAIALKSS